MKVLVIGSGAREHSIVWKLAQSERLEALHAAPGNPGIAAHAKCHDVALHDKEALTKLAVRLKVDLVVVGPEGPLVEGLGNALRSAGIPCVGPSQRAARVETSKVYAKELMDSLHVPTPRWEAFSDHQAALAAINRWRGPVVIKADGLTSGRGSFVCMTRTQAERALNLLLVDAAYGSAGRRVVVEEFVQGVEASVTILSDGDDLVAFPVVAAPKRRDEGSAGANTDGMGAMLPVEELYEDQIEEAIEAGMRPIIESAGVPFVGVLYADVMFTRSGPKILEYNCRFGEVEAQAIMRSLDCDVLELFHAAATGDLGDFLDEPLPLIDDAVVAVTAVASSYPDSEGIAKQVAVAGLADAADVDEVEVFLGSVEQTGKGKAKSIVAAGGRVLTVTATGLDPDEAAERAYEAMDHIAFDGRHVRGDIVPGFDRAVATLA